MYRLLEKILDDFFSLGRYSEYLQIFKDTWDLLCKPHCKENQIDSMMFSVLGRNDFPEKAFRRGNKLYQGPGHSPEKWGQTYQRQAPGSAFGFHGFHPFF